MRDLVQLVEVVRPLVDEVLPLRDQRVDGSDFATVLLRLREVDEEGGEAVGALRNLVRRCGAGQQQHQVRMGRPTSPNLLTVDYVA